MPDRMHALAFNELSQALKDVDRFVALSERAKITDRLVAVVREEMLREMGLHPEQIAESAAGSARPDSREEIIARLLPDVAPTVLREAADAAEVKPGSYWPHFAKWLRTRADQIATAASDAAHTRKDTQ